MVRYAELFVIPNYELDRTAVGGGYRMNNRLTLSLFAFVVLTTMGCAVTDKISLSGLRDPFQRTNTETQTEAPPPKQIKPEERFHEFVEQTNMPATHSYERAKIWAAGAFNGGIKGVMQIDEPNSRRFVIKGLIGRCNIFGTMRPYEVSFLLEFQAKENRVRLLFDKILATSFGQQTNPNRAANNPMAGLFDVELPKTDQELKLIADNCLTDIKNKLLTELTQKKGKSDW